MNRDNPAYKASRKSLDCVQNHRKEDWLALFADNACIEDPIGKSMLDPVGEGHRGKAAIERFWDQNIAPNRIEVTCHRSWTAAAEVAHLLTLTTTLPGDHKVAVEAVFTYAVDADGFITNLRGYWEMSDIAPVKP